MSLVSTYMSDQLTYNRCFNKLDPVDGARLGRPSYQRHGYGRVWHVSGYSSQPRLPDEGAEEA